MLIPSIKPKSHPRCNIQLSPLTVILKRKGERVSLAQTFFQAKFLYGESIYLVIEMIAWSNLTIYYQSPY